MQDKIKRIRDLGPFPTKETLDRIREATRMKDEIKRFQNLGLLPAQETIDLIREAPRIQEEFKEIDNLGLPKLIEAGLQMSDQFRKVFGPQSELSRAIQSMATNAARVVQSVNQSASELVRSILPTLDQFRSLSEGFDQLIKTLDKEERRAFKVLAKRGWIGLEEHLTRPAILSIVRVAELRGPKAVDVAVCRLFRRHKYKLLNQVVHAWWKVPYLAQRKGIVRDAIKAHKENRYALSIPVLFPIVDGLAVRIVGRPPGKKKAIFAKEAAEKYHMFEREVWSECVLAVITSLIYKPYDFRKRTPSTMNRHAIMHGEAIGYPTEANSMRVILLIDTFTRLLGK